MVGFMAFYNGLAKPSVRGRYLALLSEAIAAIKAQYPPSPQRARAVRRAAATCLVRAVRSGSGGRIMRRRRQVAASASPRRPAVMSTRRVAKRMRRRELHATSNTKLLPVRSCETKIGYYSQQLIYNYNNRIRVNCNNMNCNHVICASSSSSSSSCEEISKENENIISSLQLQRLQALIFHHGRSPPAPSPLHQYHRHHHAHEDPSDLLSHTASYILALQAQVDALQTLLDCPS